MLGAGHCLNPFIQFRDVEAVSYRRNGMQTASATSGLSTTNCLNCRATTLVTSSDKCAYCGSVITTDELPWLMTLVLMPYKQSVEFSSKFGS